MNDARVDSARVSAEPGPLRQTKRWAVGLATAVLVAGAAGVAGAGVGSNGGGQQASALPAAADSFPHARHSTLACLTCHVTGSGQGRLTFEAPRGCAICHHQSPTPTTCGNCHRPEQYAAPVAATVTVTVPGHAPNPRRVDFVHAQHTGRPCLECHNTPVTLAPPPATAQCQTCHVEHHSPGPTCATCHTVTDAKRDHPTPEIAHQRCDACHTPRTVALLTPDRTFCSTCHAPQATQHYEPRECTVCHFLADPAVHRATLLTPPPR